MNEPVSSFQPRSEVRHLRRGGRIRFHGRLLLPRLHLKGICGRRRTNDRPYRESGAAIDGEVYAIGDVYGPMVDGVDDAAKAAIQAVLREMMEAAKARRDSHPMYLEEMSSALHWTEEFAAQQGIQIGEGDGD